MLVNFFFCNDDIIMCLQLTGMACGLPTSADF